jgi:cardiolipin synthase
MRDSPLRHLLPPRFEWRSGNQFELMIDGDSYFPAMLRAIDGAQRSIDLEMYLANSGETFDRFVTALHAAAQRGVTVRILLDDFGTRELLETDKQRLKAPGIEVQFYNPLHWQQGTANMLRNHRKLLMVDQQVAFVGGAGLTDEFLLTSTAGTPWHEVMLKIQGPVITDWCTLFQHSWFGIRKRIFKSLPAVLSSANAGHQQGRVCASNGPHAHHVMQSLYQQIEQARQHVWIVTPYFLPSLRLRRYLIKAAQRKVDTRLLLPGPFTDHPAIRQAAHRFFARLLKNGVRIFEYQPRFIHAKIAFCDQWVTLGSTNFDRWNLRWNLDANQEVNDADFAAQIRTMLEKDFADCQELHYAHWLQRPWYLRIQEWFNGKLDELANCLR